jgi:hypothetical protein
MRLGVEVPLAVVGKALEEGTIVGSEDILDDGWDGLKLEES